MNIIECPKTNEEIVVYIFTCEFSLFVFLHVLTVKRWFTLKSVKNYDIKFCLCKRRQAVYV